VLYFNEELTHGSGYLDSGNFLARFYEKTLNSHIIPPKSVRIVGKKSLNKSNVFTNYGAMNREFLQLAQNYKPGLSIGAWLMSEKLDGMRAYWDGGHSRGLYCDQIPWANTDKDARLVNRPIATGLWSRYGKPIYAPDWWINALPPFSLDGELYIQRGQFQSLISAAKTHIPDEKLWKTIKFMVFEAPSVKLVFQNGTINNVNFKKTFDNIQLSDPEYLPVTFEKNYKKLMTLLPNNDSHIQLLTQTQLPWRTAEAEEALFMALEQITTNGGEGIMLRNPSSVWTPKRMNHLLKVKKLESDIGTIVGWLPGKGKLEGLMGSLTVRWRGRDFSLSGFTDKERSLKDGQPSFAIGSQIGFIYRELTDSGVPKEARYKR
jgi:DNA ligase-1